VSHQTTLDELFEGNREGLKVASLENYRELGVGDLEIGGRKAKWMAAEHGPEEQRMATISYLVMNGPIVVMVFGTADAEDYSKYREAFDRSAESIRFE
jgi:hypothetical protein